MTTQSANGGGNLTFSHTTSGTNRILFVGTVGGLVGTGLSNDVTAVSFNGTSLTKIGANQINAGGTGRYTTVWCLTAPALGTHNVVITSGSPDYTGGIAVDYTGVAQTGQPDANVLNQGSNFTTLGFTVTTSVDNSWTILFIGSQGNRPTAGTNCTPRGGMVSPDPFNSNGHPDAFDSNSPVTPAGSFTMTVNSSPTVFAAGIICSFAPAGGDVIAYPPDPPPSVGSAAFLYNFIN